jgi:hypothetical protein
MLKIIRNWQLRDYLRSFQGIRGYGIPIAKPYMALQWYGAYAEKEGTIIYFIARQIDNGNEVIANYEIATDRIKYENGQYLYDNTKLFDGKLPDGTFFFEFNDGYETYYSQIFTVKAMDMLFMASGAWLASGSFEIAATNINNPNQIILKRFEENELFEFED